MMFFFCFPFIRGQEEMIPVNLWYYMEILSVLPLILMETPYKGVRTTSQFFLDSQNSF